MPELLRTCRKCGLQAYSEEQLKLFSTNKKMKFGVGTICKSCDNEKWSKYHKENYVPKDGISGFKREKKAKLYYVKITTQDKRVFYKIGVTNNTVKKRFSYETEVDIETIFELKCDTGAIAIALETEVKRKHLHKKADKDEKILRYTKNTEIFKENILNL